MSDHQTCVKCGERNEAQRTYCHACYASIAAVTVATTVPVGNSVPVKQNRRNSSQLGNFVAMIAFVLFAVNLAIPGSIAIGFATDDKPMAGIIGVIFGIGSAALHSRYGRIPIYLNLIALFLGLSVVGRLFK
jgi:hypothetical protein